MKSIVFAMLACMVLFALPARAEEGNHEHFKPEDRVVFDLSAEDWVTTKTAHVAVNVEAAVNASTAGSMRGDMEKAVNGLAKGDWRLTSFDRSQDQTGLERWSAVFEARLPETDLGALGDNAKKLSKAGMQLSIANIDFTPTLAEMEATRSAIRAQIYKNANDQLVALDAAMPGRSYRIALIDFTGDDSGLAAMPRVIKGRAAYAMAPMQATAEAPPPAPVERAERITLSAHIVYAVAADKSAAPSSPAPVEPKR